MKLKYLIYGSEVKTFIARKGNDVIDSFCKRFNCELLNNRTIIKWNRRANAYDILGKIID